ncbi:hypothetical protein BSL78_08980 [Apostichopus japonicus]|uniref:Uncharacterized protein n=1 Tax=Stichopus japonicus TaxID=307972 RepID=A0A2G8L1J8_STIJA|nr:hypothetical protein BSL78_08980 [Apostichopus japonicus]
MLGTYNYEIQHRPGSKHGNADALSRRPCVDCRYCLRLEETELSTVEDTGGNLTGQQLSESGGTLDTHVCTVVTRSKTKQGGSQTDRLDEIRTDAEKGMEPATSVESPTQSGKDNGQVVPEIVAPRLELDGAWVDQWSVEDIKKAQQGDNDISRIIDWMVISKERPQWSLISAENKTLKLTGVCGRSYVSETVFFIENGNLTRGMRSPGN